MPAIGKGGADVDDAETTQDNNHENIDPLLLHSAVPSNVAIASPAEPSCLHRDDGREPEHHEVGDSASRNVSSRLNSNSEIPPPSLPTLTDRSNTDYSSIRGVSSTSTSRPSPRRPTRNSSAGRLTSAPPPNGPANTTLPDRQTSAPPLCHPASADPRNVNHSHIGKEPSSAPPATNRPQPLTLAPCVLRAPPPSRSDLQGNPDTKWIAESDAYFRRLDAGSAWSDILDLWLSLERGLHYPDGVSWATVRFSSVQILMCRLVSRQPAAEQETVTTSGTLSLDQKWPPSVLR